MLNPNAAFLLVQKLKSHPPPPTCFTLGVKAELEKIFSICPKLLINVELYLWPCIGPKAGKRIPSNLGAHGGGANVSAFINNLGPNNKPLGPNVQLKNAQSLAPRFFGPNSYCKSGLTLTHVRQITNSF
jgi:hypothetical protein